MQYCCFQFRLILPAAHLALNPSCYSLLDNLAGLTVQAGGVAHLETQIRA